MAEPIPGVCSCTKSLTCENCLRLEAFGCRFIEANGELGITLVVQERDQLRVEIERLKKFKSEVQEAFESNKNFMWGKGKWSVISKIRKALTRFDGGDDV